MAKLVHSIRKHFMTFLPSSLLLFFLGLPLLHRKARKERGKETIATAHEHEHEYAHVIHAYSHTELALLLACRVTRTPFFCFIFLFKADSLT